MQRNSTCLCVVKQACVVASKLRSRNVTQLEMKGSGFGGLLLHRNGEW